MDFDISSTFGLAEMFEEEGAEDQRVDEMNLAERRALAGLGPGWEKSLKTIDRWWLTGGREECLTVDELTTYCRTM